MKKFFVLMALTLPLSVLGCGMISVNGTGGPFLSGVSGASITVKNDSDYVISLSVNTDAQSWRAMDETGKKKTCTGMAPGTRVPINVRPNWFSDYDETVMLSVDGWADERMREPVGSHAVPLSVGVRQRYAYSLRIVNDSERGVRIEYVSSGWLFH